jgi:hypothetical protein
MDDTHPESTIHMNGRLITAPLALTHRRSDSALAESTGRNRIQRSMSIQPLNFNDPDIALDAPAPIRIIILRSEHGQPSARCPTAQHSPAGVEP